MKCLIILASLAFLPLHGNTQTVPSPESPSEHHLSLQSWLEHVESLPDTGGMSERTSLHHQRWLNFWEGRMNAGAAEGMTPGYLLDTYQSLEASANDGWNWQQAGPGNLTSQNNGRVECAATPSGVGFMQEFLLASPSGGIWRSGDGGENWHCTSDDDFTMPGIGCHWLVYHPQNDNVVFASITLATTAEVSLTGKEMGYGLGIYRSDDGGETWSPTPFSFQPVERQLTTKILINPENGEQMYAAVNDKVYYTGDAWNTFSLVFDHFNQSYDYREKVVADLETEPGNFGKLWVSSSGVESWTWVASPVAPGEFRYHAAELWTSGNALDPEIVWQQIQTPLHPTLYQEVSNDSQPSRVLISTLDESSPDHIYVGYKLFQGMAYVWKSQDAGLSWQMVLEDNLDNVDGHFQLEMEVSPDNPDRLYFAQRRVKMYDLGNPSLPPVELIGPHVDTRFLQLILPSGTSPTGEEVLLQGNDGGLTQITEAEGMLNWTNLNGTGLGIQQLFGLAVVPEPDARIVAGSQDNHAFRNGPSGWNNFLSGDRYDPVIREDGSGFVPLNPHYISEFTDVHGSVYASAFPDPQGKAYFNRPVAQDGNGRMYIGYSDLWFLDDPEGDWYSLSNLNYGKVRAIAVSENGKTGVIGYSGATWGETPEKKLMVSTNLNTQSPNWFDLTPMISSAIGGLGISAIAVDPKNSNRLIIGFEYFHFGQEELRIAEILLNPAAPGLASVEYIGTGLPDVPVNDLCFIPGEPGELLLGNDIGVFKWNGDAWDMINGEMPLVFVSDIEYDPFGNSVWISTFGRGLWRADLPCESKEAVTLLQDVEWSGHHWISSPIIVPENVTLTISGTAHFQEDAGIQVEPGGRLEISGWLTASCEESLWPGIEAHGQEDLAQHPAIQASVRLEEGAVIEHARIGVLLGQRVPGCDDFNNGGAMIYADQAGFRDNSISVAFAPYRDLNDLGYSIANKSRITRSSFKITDSLSGAFRAHIALDNVNRVYLAGCSFLGDEADPIGTGILSRNATFLLESACTSVQPESLECPPANRIRNRFSGLKRGIDARAWLDTETFTIEASDFEDCAYSLRAISVMYASASDISIHVPEYVGQYDLPFYGMHWIGCSGYEISDNEIFASDPADEAVGLIITDSQDDPNRVAANSFHHLSYAILAQGDNRDDTPNPESDWDPTSSNSGLQFLCNRFWENDYDLSVTQDGAIAAVQGTPNASSPFGVDPAHNEFYSTLCPDENNLHINPDSEGFHYYYPEGNNLLIPDFGCFNESEVWLQEIQPELLPYPEFVYEEVCAMDPAPAEFPNGLGQWSAGLDSWELLDTEVKQLTDGGNSQQLLSFLADPANDQKDLKVKLLPLSPWLSEPVLHALIDRSEDLDELTLYQILSANAPLSAAVLNRLEQEGQFSEWWFSQLQNLQGTSNSFFRARTQLAALRSQLNRQLGKMLRSCLVDSDSCLISEWMSIVSADERNPSLRLLAAIGPKAGKDLVVPDNYIDTDSDHFSGFCEALLGKGDLSLACAELSSPPCWRSLATRSFWQEDFEESLSIPLPNLKVQENVQEGQRRLIGFPNPAVESWIITGFRTLDAHSWKLRSPDGRISARGSCTGQALTIPCGHLAQGVYVLELETATELLTMKLVKE